MQALLVVAKGDRSSAEALEPSELMSNLTLAGTILTDGHELYDDCRCWVARYALVCANVLKLKGFNAGVDQAALLSHRPDEFRPRWHNKYIKQHRGYLVMLGWIRYFNKRGCTGNVTRESGRDGPMDLIRQASSPAILDSRFQELDNWCDLQGLESATRPYSDYQDLPAAFELHP